VTTHDHVPERRPGEGGAGVPAITDRRTTLRGCGTGKLDREPQEMGPFDPGPATIADSVEKADAFLASQGFL
jgi:hypothetical protein